MLRSLMLLIILMLLIVLDVLTLLIVLFVLTASIPSASPCTCVPSLLGRIIFGIETVLSVVLLEVKQAACNFGKKCASQDHNSTKMRWHIVI